MSGSMQQLSERLRRKMEQDRRQIEELTTAQWNGLADGLRKQLSAVLNTTAADTERALTEMRNRNRSLRRRLPWTWLPPLIAGAVLTLAATHAPSVLETIRERQSRQLQDVRMLERTGITVQQLPDRQGQSATWLVIPPALNPVVASDDTLYFRLEE